MSAERRDPAAGGAGSPGIGAESAGVGAGSPRPQAEDDLLAGLPALLRDLAAAGVVELEVSAGESRLYIRQRLGAASIVPVASGAGPAVTAAGSAPPEEEAGLVTVVTPLAGVYYASPAPDDPPFVA